MIYYGVFFLSVLISSVSQILLKKSANNKSVKGIQEYLNPKVIIAYIMFFGASFLSTFAYRGVPLQLGPVIEASAYIYILILGKLFLDEKITGKKLLGTTLIICGILVCSLG